MDGRMSVYNLMKYQKFFLVQTVERILIIKQINVLEFIIISLLYFHSLLYRLSSWYFHLKIYALMFTLNRCEIVLLFTRASVAMTNISLLATHGGTRLLVWLMITFLSRGDHIIIFNINYRFLIVYKNWIFHRLEKAFPFLKWKEVFICLSFNKFVMLKYSF